MKKQIIVTGDIFRPRHPGKGFSQNGNIQWLYNILQQPLSMVTDTPVSMVLAPPEGQEISPEFFYSCFSQRVTPQAWAATYRLEKLPPKLIEKWSTIFSESMVIGFELTPTLTSLFQASGIPYINIEINPIRFFDDIILSFSTNMETLFSTLIRYRLDQNQIRLSAGLHKAMIGRTAPLDLKKGSMLFIGQTTFDRSLVRQGQVVNISDYSQQLQKEAARFQCSYFKLHPYDQEKERTRSRLEEMGFLEIPEDVNIYQLLCNSNIEQVIGISSSVLAEADYFGKPAKYLYRPLIELDCQDELNYSASQSVSIFEDFLYPDFWQSLLSAAGIPCKEVPRTRLPFKNSRLRISLRNFWGYGYLDQEVVSHELNQKPLPTSKKVLAKQLVRSFIK